jgi:hypothetical protein
MLFGESSGNTHIVFCRFLNITIPKDTTITSAFVRFQAGSNQSGGACNQNIHFHLEGDVIQSDVDSGAKLVAANLTTPVAWNSVPGWSIGNDYDTSEIKTALQEVIDHASWVSGNAVCLQIEDNGSDAWALRQPRTWDYATAIIIELHVTWIP